MAINTESKRASVLNVGSFFPGRIPYLTEPDGTDLGSKNERGVVLHNYAPIVERGIILVSIMALATVTQTVESVANLTTSEAGVAEVQVIIT